MAIMKQDLIIKINYMNLTNEVMVKSQLQDVKVSPVEIKDAPVITDGICIDCENRLHCVWQENNKYLCEHFE